MKLFTQNTDSDSHRYEAIFNHASLGIVVVNSNGIIVSVNPFTLKLFGYLPEELIQKPVEVLIPPQYHHTHVAERTAYIHHPIHRPMGVGMNLSAIRKDGTTFPVEVSLGNYQERGELYVIAFISDISLRMEAEAEINRLNNKLEASVEQRTHQLTCTLQQLERSKQELFQTLEKEKELGELKSRFVSMASHEFRTPLSTVLSSAYLIEKYITTDEQSKRQVHLQRIVSSVNMLTDLLNDFLCVGKIESGKMEVRSSRFDIQALVTTMIKEMQDSLKDQQRIEYVHKGPTEIILDASLLKHIVMNLISNAGKFSPERSTIEINTECYRDYIMLSVKDHGIGISKEDQMHLAERFFRGANASNIQGTGLGLHIVSKYAELMNGTVECKSELEKGTEFLIVFKTKT